MATPFTRNRKSDTTALAPVPTLADLRAEVASIEQIRDYLPVHTARVRELEQELATVDEQIGEYITEKVMGNRVDPKLIQDLYGRKSTLEVDLEEARLTVSGLEARLVGLQDQQNARQAALCKAELEQLAAQSPQVEANLLDALRAVGAAYNAYHAHTAAIAAANRAHDRYSPTCASGIARPRPPFVIPEEFMRYGEYSPAVMNPIARQIDDWVAEPARHQEFRAAEVARMATEQERIRKVQEEEVRGFRATVRNAIREGRAVFAPFTGRQLTDVEMAAIAAEAD